MYDKKLVLHILIRTSPLIFPSFCTPIHQVDNRLVIQAAVQGKADFAGTAVGITRPAGI